MSPGPENRRTLLVLIGLNSFTRRMRNEDVTSTWPASHEA